MGAKWNQPIEAPPKEDEHTVAQQLTLVHGPHQYGVRKNG